MQKNKELFFVDMIHNEDCIFLLNIQSIDGNKHYEYIFKNDGLEDSLLKDGIFGKERSIVQMVSSKGLMEQVIQWFIKNTLKDLSNILFIGYDMDIKMKLLSRLLCCGCIWIDIQDSLYKIESSSRNKKTDILESMGIPKISSDLPIYERMDLVSVIYKKIKEIDQEIS